MHLHVLADLVETVRPIEGVQGFHWVNGASVYSLTQDHGADLSLFKLFLLVKIQLLKAHTYGLLDPRWDLRDKLLFD